MQKPMKTMLIIVALFFAAIFLYKFIIGRIIAKAMSSQSQAVYVSVMQAEYSDWQDTLSASGSLRAVQGVNVTGELAGIVNHIYFSPGNYVKKDAILVQLNANSDIALLHALQANADLAKLTLTRDKAQFAIQAISKQVLDNDVAKLKNASAQVEQQQAIVLKKTIRAPFSGYIGINYLSPGQYINPGDKLASLQSLDPLYVDFFQPQQVLEKLKLGQIVRLSIDAFPQNVFEGKITTIEPLVDTSTRNVAVEATLQNENKLLKPGMFVNVEVIVGKPLPFITVPQTAITFNSYGNLIYIVDKSQKDANGKPVLTVKQRFVTSGETRGEQIQILKGLQKGETFVTSGQLKLRNASQILINNALVPSNNKTPDLRNNH